MTGLSLIIFFWHPQYIEGTAYQSHHQFIVQFFADEYQRIFLRCRSNRFSVVTFKIGKYYNSLEKVAKLIGLEIKF
jgi:hypothetical protein